MTPFSPWVPWRWKREVHLFTYAIWCQPPLISTAAITPRWLVGMKQPPNWTPLIGLWMFASIPLSHVQSWKATVTRLPLCRCWWGGTRSKVEDIGKIWKNKRYSILWSHCNRVQRISRPVKREWNCLDHKYDKVLQMNLVFSRKAWGAKIPILIRFCKQGFESMLCSKHNTFWTALSL